MTDSPSTEIKFELHPSSSRVPDAERERILENPGFGQVFTDHMITLKWSAERGWHDGRLEPYGPFALDPATAVFHYSQELFEGLKAYRQASGSVVMFRPQANAARFVSGSQRMAMPDLPESAFVHSLELLVGQDKEWIPAGEGNSLYLRPFMIATQRGLGVNHAATEFLYCAIASPAGAYFGASKAVRVWLSEDYTRAAPGGTGAVKTGGNYAAAFRAQEQAVANGCDQVVWLDHAEHQWVEEMGGMNLFFVYGSGSSARIMTPSLTGSLLPGITRDSLLRLAPTLGIPASEGRISVSQWREGCASGEITEVFACGTAAVITPVGSVASASSAWTIGSGEPGPVSMRLREELIGIQYGHKPDPFGWVHKVALSPGGYKPIPQTPCPRRFSPWIQAAPAGPLVPRGPARLSLKREARSARRACPRRRDHSSPQAGRAVTYASDQPRVRGHWQLSMRHGTGAYADDRTIRGRHLRQRLRRADAYRPGLRRPGWRAVASCGTLGP